MLLKKISNTLQRYLFIIKILIKEMRGAIVVNSYAWMNFNGTVDHSNWGDDINYFFLKEISTKPIIPYQHAPLAKRFNRPNYIVIGSTIDLLADGKSIIWGAGIIDSNTNTLPKFRKICAVRGPQTRKKLLGMGYNCPEIYGDPALLLPLYYTPKVSKKYKYGVIPHFHEIEIAQHIFADKEDVFIINLSDYIKWTDVIDQMNSCVSIISSSLHGLIVAEAYGIPYQWIEFNDGEKRDPFKYFDFFESIGVTQHPILISDYHNLAEIDKKLKGWKPGYLDTTPLLNACPFSFNLNKRNQ